MLDRTFLRSRVARRIFGLFLVSAFVPVLVLALLAWHQVRQTNETHARQHLQARAGAYARALHERLLNAGLALRALAESPLDLATVLQGGGLHEEVVFRRVIRVAPPRGGDVGPAATADWMPAAPSDREWLHLAGGRAVLRAPTARNGAPWLGVAVDPADPARGLLWAELGLAFLWETDEGLGSNVEVCVVQTAQVLHCSDPAHAHVALALDGTADGAPASFEGMDVVARSVPLKAAFDAPPWRVVFMHPRDGVGAATLDDAWRLGAMVLFTLLLVAWLSVLQIRRTLVPIDRLTEGARRFAKQRFDEPVAIDDERDEFGQLARALNGMARQLGTRIEAMRVLADIDRELLAGLDLDRVRERVARRIEKLLPGAQVRVLATRDDEPRAGGSPWTGAAHDGDAVAAPPRALIATLTRRAALWLRRDDGTAADEPWAPPSAWSDALLAQLGLERGLVLPALWRDRVCALVAVAGVEPAQVGDSVLRQLRELTDRVAVAFAARARERMLEHQASHDMLTGLPNRMLLKDRVERDIAAARRNQQRVALLFIDLDRFKQVNDTLGHGVGDALLTQAVQRLRACVRDSDTIGRLGGDEFAVALPELRTPHDAARVADQVVATLSAPFRVGHQECFIGASVGVAMYPDDGKGFDELLAHADIAMYRAKGAGRGCVVFFEAEMNAQERDRRQLAHDLRRAIERRELEVHFQPRVDAASGRIVSAEALVRWTHPQLGAVPPARFVPIAEEVGLIDALGEHVLAQACQRVAAWRRAGCRVDRVSVNVSARQLRGGHLLHAVRRELRAAALPPDTLELEVTEGTIVDASAAVTELLHTLRTDGVRIALDDFGTGYSSMIYLRRLPTDVIKVDRSFVAEMADDPRALSIVGAIVAMAKALGMSVTAEGVETQAQAELLVGLGVDELQGYLYGRPMPAGDFAARLERVEADDAVALPA
ncbi:putative bifunctional diguanylate cyclase/phosphodiesterase [Azohydromonas sediminis]|uniref:putative bifunctional diguanylate cyclase/phosphodiesterase n=1 Tax=Azohydromonas sediminis TaxID=2259674 RepID=UPI000E64897A|nr:EAL domain-containing protein [Azohydromonas sediminis]